MTDRCVHDDLAVVDERPTCVDCGVIVPCEGDRGRWYWGERGEPCHHDDTFEGVCVWCREHVGTAPTDEQARIVGDLLGIRLVRKENPCSSP